jgi:hypothetical protein
MRPIQTATESLSRAKQNITLAVIEIEKTHEYFRISSSCQDIISGGIKSGNYEDFFDAMDRLSNARKFFVSHREIKSSGSAIINIDSLLKRAVSMCLAELQSLLNKCGDAVEYVEGTVRGINPMEDNLATSIREICQTLSKSCSFLLFIFVFASYFDNC